MIVEHESVSSRTRPWVPLRNTKVRLLRAVIVIRIVDKQRGRPVIRKPYRKTGARQQQRVSLDGAGGQICRIEGRDVIAGC